MVEIRDVRGNGHPLDLVHVLLGDGSLHHLSFLIGPRQVHLRALRGHHLRLQRGAGQLVIQGGAFGEGVRSEKTWHASGWVNKVSNGVIQCTLVML